MRPVARVFKHIAIESNTFIGIVKIFNNGYYRHEEITISKIGKTKTFYL
jgi:hypothetical protein